MRCHICDSSLSSISFNRDHRDINPCGTCQEVINDLLAQSDTPVDDLTDSEIEPTPEEMMEDTEKLAYGQSFE